ncbi:MAG: CPBP family intramembrane metalloprotease [Pedobacter sp.]|nr:MAG: CPBP family intramembrane metalloprotease [Pedobacter sp.]
MQYKEPVREENHPFLQLILLLAVGIGGLLIFAIIAIVICVIIYGTSILTDMSWATGNNLEKIGALKIFLTAQQIGLFLTPALLLAIFERKKPQHFYGMSAPKVNYLGIVFLIMICSTPFMAWVNLTNQQMHLPAALKGLEKWMRLQEDQAMVTTKAILSTKTIAGLLANLFVIAIMPAICEEFIFRGGLQRTIFRWLKNPHVAIWVSAIIFSAIHVQFFGFFPRLFLGAAFGYLYFWTGSIWYAVFAHFLNNAYAVIVAFYLQKQNLPLDDSDDLGIAWYGYLISAILTLALFWILKEKTAKERQEISKV